MKENKEKALREIIRALRSAMVAFSGGVDSTLLLYVCHEALGEGCMAATARSAIHPAGEVESARKFAQSLGVRHIIIETNELNTPAFVRNPPDRCYYCKRNLLTLVREAADEHGLAHVLEGTNADDAADHRPGLRAAREMKARQPLREAGLTKADIRDLSRKLGLPGWDKPAQPCLASRVPYGDAVTGEALEMIEAGEAYLHALGLRQCRVRHHDTVARIELPPEDIARFHDEKVRAALVAKFKEIGYNYVTLDMEGYRSGSMNESLGSP